MKILKRILVFLAVLIVAVVVTLIFWGGHVIKQTVERVGPAVLGVPVTLEHARFHPLRGYVSLTGMVVGNPEGFETDSLFDMDHLEIAINTRSLFTDTIIIERIAIQAPRITYERGLLDTNIDALLAGLESEVAEEEPAEEEVEAAPGKTVVIEKLVIEAATVRLSAKVLQGLSVPITLGTIELDNLGGPDQSVSQIMLQVTRAVGGAVVNGVLNAGGVLGDGVMAAFDGVGALGGAAVDGALAVGGAAVDGAAAVGGAAVGGARAVTEGVGSGIRNIGNLITGGDEPAAAE